MAELQDALREPQRASLRPRIVHDMDEEERARLRGVLIGIGARPENGGASAAAARPAPDPARTGGRRSRPRWPVVFVLLAAGAIWLHAERDDLAAALDRQLASLTVPASVSSAAVATPQPETAALPAPPAPAAVLEASGSVVARRKATVSSDITGRIVSIAVMEGDRVEEGQEIARLDPMDAEAQFAVAHANVDAAIRDREIAAAELAATDGDLQRTRILAKRGVASAGALEALENEQAVLRARIAASEAHISVQERQLDAIRREIDKTIIRAPFGGIITEVTASVGEIVSPVASGGYTQTGIATIVDPRSIVGEVNVNEQLLSQLEAGQEVRMTVPAWPDRSFQGTVALVTPMVNESTAAVKVTLAFDPLPDRVYPGMRLDASFLAPAN